MLNKDNINQIAIEDGVPVFEMPELPNGLKYPASPPPFKFSSAIAEDLSLNLSDRLEKFVEASRKLEQTLEIEKQKTHTLSYELDAERKQLAKALEDFHFVKSSLIENEQKSQTLRRQIIELSQKLTKATEELAAYRDRWGQVLSKESNLKQILPRLESEQLKNLELSEELKKQKTKHAAFEAHTLKEMNTAADRIIELEDKNEELEEKITKLHDQLRSKEKEIQAKIENVALEYKIKIEALDRTIDEKDIEIKDLQALSFKLRQKLEMLNQPT